MNLDVHGLVEEYRGGADPRETVAGSLARLKEVHEVLNTTIAFLDERALAAAEESAAAGPTARRGRWKASRSR